jgi:hypothetical protein
MWLVQNERRKLTATALNSVAITIAAAGFIAPIVAVSYGMPGAPGSLYFAAVSAVWLFAAVGLHLIARAMLGGLKE